MLKIAVPLTLAAIAGATVVVQQVLNANLRTALNSAAWSGVASYITGGVCIAGLALLLRDPMPSAAVLTGIPWWAWTGGILGAFYIVMSIYLVPTLGAATFIALLVTGQMLASVAIDQMGWLGLAQRSIDLPRIVGVILLIVAVILIRR